MANRKNTQSSCLLFIVFVGFIFFIDPNNLLARERPIVGYGGLWTAGVETNYPVYSRIKQKHGPKLARAIGIAIEKVADSLPFEVLFETDAERMKKHIDNPYTLAVAITRDDVVTERFVTAAAEINKTIVNVGMVIILYQTAPDPNNPKKQRNVIMFSVPLVGYLQQLEGDKRLTEDDIENLFILTATRTINDYLVNRLKGIYLDTINGSVVRINDDRVIVNIGALHGIERGSYVDFLDEKGKRIGKGVVKDLSKTECVVRTDGSFNVFEMNPVRANICKGMSEDTYQVVSFKITSKKGAQMFDEKKLGQQVSQWFSDFLVARAGKTVLPSKLNGEWVTEATGESFAVFVKDGQAHRFEVPEPKYSVHLDLTGANCMMVDGNNVNEIWAYKAWLKVDIPEKTFSKKYDETSSKNVVSGIQKYTERDEFFDLIHQLTAKAAMEESL